MSLIPLLLVMDFPSDISEVKLVMPFWMALLMSAAVLMQQLNLEPLVSLLYSSCHLAKLHATGDADLGTVQEERRMKNGCLDKMFFPFLFRWKDYRMKLKKRGCGLTWESNRCAEENFSW